MDRITKEKREIRNYLETVQFLNEGTDDYFFIWDICAERVYFAGDVYKKYRLPFRGEEGNTVQECQSVLFPKDLAAFERQMRLLAQGREKTCSIECRVFDKEGRREWITCKGRGRKDEKGCPHWVVGRISGGEIIHKVDSLTGAFNADKFMKDMHKCHEYGCTGYLLVLGIDNLKSINMKYGRNYGNHVLKRVSEALESQVDASLDVYRLDGDRFAVMLQDVGQEYVRELYGRVQRELKEYCTVSAGAAFCDGNQGGDCNIVYQYAEASLDCAKKDGKNILVFFSEEAYKESLDKLSLQEEMRQSIREGCSGFYLCYQPLIDSRNFRLWGSEALLRYHSPSRGVTGPAEFIPLLEQTELICPVGEWIIRTALRQCKEWRKQIPDFQMNVNISYVQLQKDDICEKVLEILEETGLPGDALTLEVTEGMQLQDYPYFNKIFFRWKEAGIKIAIDDFGTGYSSLSYLKSIEIDEVKIDRCFVSNIQHSAYNHRLLSNVIELAHSARIKVCCEGIETEEELIALKEMKPDVLQGYLFDKPCVEADFEKKYIQPSCNEYEEREKKEAHFRNLDCGEDKRFLEILKEEKLGSIVEGMDDVIYVSDLDSYELQYLNNSGRRLTGLYAYKGQKCYKVLFDRETPCEFCEKCRREEENFHVWETENEFLNRHFIIKGKVMPWQGKMVRLEIASDVTKQEIANRKIREKLAFEKIIVKCSRILVEEKEIKAAIREVLGYIGEFYEADRAYVFEPGEGDDFWKNTYEWCADGIAPMKKRLQKVSEHKLACVLGVLRKDESFMIPDVGAVKDDFTDICEELEQEDVSSLIVTPIWKEDRLIGFVGVDNQKHGLEDDALINTMSYFLGDRISSEATKERLNELLDCRYEDILKNTNMGLWVIHIDKEHEKYELYTDKTMRRILGIKGNPGPEECYRHWYSRIKEEDYPYVNREVENMIESGKVIRVEYRWNHPCDGEIRIRCVGIRGEAGDGVICLEGYHSTISE